MNLYWVIHISPSLLQLLILNQLNWPLLHVHYCFSFLSVTFQVELVLDLEETVPKKFVDRAYVKKHVEYPNKDESKVF